MAEEVSAILKMLVTAGAVAVDHHHRVHPVQMVEAAEVLLP
jgi:hypothetical protein